MKSAWAIGVAVTLIAHSALGVGLATYRSSPVKPPKKTVVRFQAWRPPPEPEKKEPEPPPPTPKTPPPPRVVKRDKPRPPQPVDKPVATRTHIEPAPSGITDDASADKGTLVAQAGDGVEGPVQKGDGKDRVVAPPPPPPPPAPRRVFVPLLEVTRVPRAIDPVQPEVPESWKESGREAVVVVEVAISAEGKVLAARAIKRAGEGLDEAAVAAALKTRFEPALVGTKPVAVKMQLPYRFKVRG